jgi:hypothetical protein
MRKCSYTYKVHTEAKRLKEIAQNTVLNKSDKCFQVQYDANNDNDYDDKE